MTKSLLLLLALGLASCAAPPIGAPVVAAPGVAPPSTPAAAELRAVVHLSDPSRPANARGLQNVANGLKALGDEPARFVLVVHGQALGWFRRGEPENLGGPLAALLATGKVELRVCAKTLEENHWVLSDLVPGAVVVPSGTIEVLRLQQQGFLYFRP